MNISPEKQNDLTERMRRLGIKEEDLVEKFVLGSGSGGQKINKTSSCVYLKHLPDGIEVKCQQGRSREANRFYARRLLVEKLEKLHFDEKSKKEKELDKLRRQKKRRSRRQKAKMIEEKKKQGAKKELRKTPFSEHER